MLCLQSLATSQQRTTTRKYRGLQILNISLQDFSIFSSILHQNYMHILRYIIYLERDMYKQCIELLTAQGNNPQKSFQVISGTSSTSSSLGVASGGKDQDHGHLKKDFDGNIKGNVFIFEGQKVLIPPGGEKSQTPKLEIIHRYLVLQVLIASGDAFSLELHVKDKHNVRLSVVIKFGRIGEGSCLQMEPKTSLLTKCMPAFNKISIIRFLVNYVIIPNQGIKRNHWINLCIDMQSFVNECFGKSAQANGQGLSIMSHGLSQGAGDSTPTMATNIFKCLEQVQLEGRMRVRKIFSTRSQIPCENDQQMDLQLQDAVPEIESLPKNFDFNPSANAISQLLNYDIVYFHIMNAGASIEDSMVITGMQIQRKGQKVSSVIGKQKNAIDQNPPSTETSFRPNKFGLMNSNKTCESFQNQKSTGTNQTQSTTVYSNRTGSSSKRLGIQSSSSPFNKMRRNKQKDSQILGLSENEDNGQIQQQRSSLGAIMEVNGTTQTKGSFIKNISQPPPLNRGGQQPVSQSRKSPGKERDISQKGAKQISGSQQVAGTTPKLRSHHFKQSILVFEFKIVFDSSQLQNPQMITHASGFQQIHQTTIVEEYETQPQSERPYEPNQFMNRALANMKTPPHFEQQSQKEGNPYEPHPYTEGDFEAWGEEEKSAFGSFCKPQPQQQLKAKGKQSSIKHEDGQTTPAPRGSQLQTGVRMKMLQKEIIEATRGEGGNSIEDSIGIIGSSIGKSAAQGSRRRNVGQQQNASKTKQGVSNSKTNPASASGPSSKLVTINTKRINAIQIVKMSSKILPQRGITEERGPGLWQGVRP